MVLSNKSAGFSYVLSDRRPQVPTRRGWLPFLVFCSLGAVVFAAGMARSDDFLAAFEELDADPRAFEDAVVLPGGFGPELLLAQDKIGDPAVETVDEMTRRDGASGGSSGSSSPLRDRWDKIRDPAIETVDEQTRKVDEKKEKKKEWYERINIRGYTQFRINSVLWSNEELAPPYHPGDRSVAPLNHFWSIRVFRG